MTAISTESKASPADGDSKSPAVFFEGTPRKSSSLPVLAPSLSKSAQEHLHLLTETLSGMPLEELERLGEALFRAYRNDKQVFTLGNGGSSSTASHMAADLDKNTIGANMHRFRITCLADNVSIMTALANDVGYENIFVEQLMNHIRAGDVLLAVSASGNSPNVLRAMRYARSQSAEVAALLGFDGGAATRIADIAIVIPSTDYGVVEDAHLIINHILVDFFRARLMESRPWVI